MKNLANCTPREFLVQTNKIRKSVDNWLGITNILEIRRNVPDVSNLATDAEKEKALHEQVRKNLNAMLEQALEKHPEETAELLGLICFIEPEDLDNHKMSEFIGSIAEVINCPEVISFFSSLVKLGQTGTSVR